MSENESEVEETREEEEAAEAEAHEESEVEEATAGEDADDEDLADDEEDFVDDEEDDDASEGKAGSVSSEQSNDDTLYTLTEVSERTNISMPTLQRYKKNYQDRIPSVGEGRTQRYPPESLPVFEKLKEENMKRRGRPRKNASEKRSKAAPQRRRPIGKPTKAEDTDELLTLKQIEEMTGISYPTLLRYVKTNLNRIPHTGSGRRRRYPPEAVEIFKTLREESRRGRRASKTGPVQVGSSPSTPRSAPEGGGAVMSQSAVTDLVQRMKELQRSHQQLQRQVQKLEKEIQKPLKVTVKRGA